LDVEEREDSAERFLEGSLIRPLQVVCKDFAALRSESAVVIMERSADAISAMLQDVKIFLGRVWSE
jgi:hypothetical protein